MDLQATRTGQVTIEHFDIGVVTTLGGVVATLASGLREYQIPVVGVTNPPGRVSGLPVFFTESEPSLAELVFPCFVVVRRSVEPDLARWGSIGHLAYKMPVGSDVEVTLPNGEVLEGSDEYEVRQAPIPYNLSYEIQVLAMGERQRTDAHVMLQAVLAVYSPGGVVRLLDSLDEARTYEAYGEGFEKLDEVLSVSERLAGWGRTIRIQGELDVVQPATVKSVAQLPDSDVGRL